MTWGHCKQKEKRKVSKTRGKKLIVDNNNNYAKIRRKREQYE